MTAFLLGLISVWVLISMLTLMTIAFRLKRICDALEGKGPSLLTAPINSYGEGIGDAIQGQMIRGQRGVDQYEGRDR